MHRPAIARPGQPSNRHAPPEQPRVPRPTGRLHPAAHPRDRACVLLAVYAAASLCASGAVLRQMSLAQGAVDLFDGLDRIAEHGGVTLATVTRTCASLALTAAVVVFLAWFHRAARNANALDPVGTGYAGPMTVIVWFVPVVGLFLGRLMAYAILRSSGLPDADGALPRQPRTFLNLWWLVVGAAVLTRVVPAGEGGDLADFLEVRRFEAVSDLIQVAAAVMTVLLVRRISRLQERTAAARCVLPAPSRPSAADRTGTGSADQRVSGAGAG